MKKAKRTLLNLASRGVVFAGTVSGMVLALTSPAYAADSWLPKWIQQIVDTFSGSPIPAVQRRVQWALAVLFVVVFLVAITYSALAAIKFISSQGESGKLEESKAAVKAILMGFAAMLVAIVGIFVVVWLFNQRAQIETTIEPTY